MLKKVNFVGVLVLLCWAQIIMAGEYEADILILGAGTAGVAAARKLTELNLTNFIILEAETRAGGRVRDVQFGGKTVETGAAIIRGTDRNPIYELAKHYGLQMVNDYDYYDVIARMYDGVNVTEEVYKYSYDLEEAIDATEKIRQRLIKNGEADMTYRTALALNGWNPVYSQDDVTEFNETLIKEATEYAYLDYEFSIPPEQLSLKYNGYYEIYEKFKLADALITDQRGFAHLHKSILAEFLIDNDPRLHLGKLVKKIKTDDTTVAVTTKNGDVYKANYVLCTFGPGVLQNDLVQFEPELPAWKREEIHRTPVTYYLKVFMKFPDGSRPFWDNYTQIYHVHPRRGYYPYIQNLQADGQFTEGSNLLLAILTGTEAVRVSRIPKSTVIEELNTMFRSMYGDTAVDVEDVYIPDWIHNPLTLGASNMQPSGRYETISDSYSKLRWPVGGVYFAGDYTSPEFPGYMLGAWYEGIRAAEEIHGRLFT